MTIARESGTSKNKVEFYFAKFKEGKLNTKALLALDDPIPKAKLFAGTPPYKKERYKYLKDNLGYLISGKLLAKRKLNPSSSPNTT